MGGGYPGGIAFGEYYAFGAQPSPIVLDLDSVEFVGTFVATQELVGTAVSSFDLVGTADTSRDVIGTTVN